MTTGRRASSMLVAALAGAGGLAGHFWHNIPKEKPREMSDLLHDGDGS